METITPQSPDHTQPNALLSYFNRTEWLLYSSFLVAGVLLRWLMLDMRPYHHDESLHGMYGRYFYDWPNSNFYRYDPMLHGPMLYNCMRFIYASFGDSLWAARTPVCIMGTAFMLVPLLFRDLFSKTSLLVLTAFIALSPTLVYWSRFLREDYWVVTGMLLCVYGFLKATPSTKAFWVFFGLSIQWCTKENVFVTLAIFIGYLVFEFAFRFVVHNNEQDSFVYRIVRYISRHPWTTCWGFILAFLMYCWFYSAGFRFPDGIVDGLGGKGFEYWMKHHDMERIEGPFNFHTYVLGWYELPFFLAFLTHLVLFYWRTRVEFKLAGALSILALLLAVAFTYNADLRATWKFFKLKDYYDLVGLFILLFHAPIVTIHHLLRREYGLGACAYFFSATYFVYSYLGEKVPWLSIYPLIFGLPYLTLFFQHYFQRHPVPYKRYPVDRALLILGSLLILIGMIFIFEEKIAAVSLTSFFESPNFVENRDFLWLGALLISCALCSTMGRYLGTFNCGRALTVFAIAFMLRASIQTNFLYAGKDNEYLSQVHTTYEIADFARRVVDDVLYERPAYRPKVLVTGDATWPLTWYFRHLPNEYRFSATPEEQKNFTYIVQDYKDPPQAGQIPDGFYSRKVNLRGWWVPDFSQMTLKKFLRYAINHYPWSTTGFTYVTVLTAKDTSKFLEKP
jgi:uncharacterized protein (TIGR03663 family)